MNSRTLLKIAIVLVIASVIAALYFSPVRAELTRDNMRNVVGQLRGLWYGPLAFIAAFAAGCLFGLPAMLFMLPAGVIFGWKLGGLYCIAGGMIGSTASYFLGRFLGEGVLHRFGKVGQFAMKQADHAGFRTILVLRLIPGIPFPVLNYGLGVANVRFVDFVTATLVGIMPSMFIFAYSADALFSGTLSEGEAFKRLIIAAALLLTIVLLPVALKRFVRRPAA